MLRPACALHVLAAPWHDFPASTADDVKSGSPSVTIQLPCGCQARKLTSSAEKPPLILTITVHRRLLHPLLAVQPYLTPVWPELGCMGHAQHIWEGASAALTRSPHADLTLSPLHHKHLQKACVLVAGAVAVCLLLQRLSTNDAA